MNWQPIIDSLTAFAVLAGIFLLAYSAIRKKDLKDTAMELTEIVKGKAEDSMEVVKKYA